MMKAVQYKIAKELFPEAQTHDDRLAMLHQRLQRDSAFKQFIKYLPDVSGNWGR